MIIMVLIVSLALSAPLCAQKANQPFTGALELRLGWGVPIDFDLDNNIFTLHYLHYRLLALPWQVGIHSSKALSSETYMEIGLAFHRRNSSWVYSYQHS